MTEKVRELKLANIKDMTKEQLELAIGNCFEYAPDASPIDRLAVLQEADFYRRELDRRHDDRVELRSLLLELAVIGLILLEIVLSVYGIRLAIKEEKEDAAVMESQNSILNNLQTSTQSTAVLLGQELDLEYALAINVEYGGGDGIQVFNNSRSPTSLSGINVDRVLAKIRRDRQTVIPDHNVANIALIEYDPKLRSKAQASIGKPFIFPIEIYLSNARGKEFVWKGRLSYGNSSGNMSGLPNGLLMAEPWNEEIKKVLQIPSVNP
jgi:hypothetical protein